MVKDSDITKSAKIKWGDWFFSEIQSAVHIETSGWSVERVERVQSRLQAKRPASERLTVIIPWLEVFTAFTVPGNYIYFSRRLLEMCQDDEMAAFVIAHEISHHDLGHVDIFPEWLTGLTGEQIAPLLTAFYRNLEKRIYGPQWECDADKHAIDLCVLTGYDPSKCLAVFDILEKFAIDVGDMDIVFGPQESDEELSDDASLLTRLRIWMFQMTRGYLPIRDRREMLVKYVSASKF